MAAKGEKHMKNNTAGRSTRNIRVSLPRNALDELERRAAAIHLSADEFALFVLIDWIGSGKKFEMQED